MQSDGWANWFPKRSKVNRVVQRRRNFLLCRQRAAVAILGDTFRQRIDLKRTIQLTAFLLRCLCRVTYMRVFAARWSRTLGVRQFFKKSRAHVYSPFRRSNFGERKMFCFLACYSIIFPLLVTILTPETNQSQDQSV